MNVGRSLQGTIVDLKFTFDSTVTSPLIPGHSYQWRVDRFVRRTPWEMWIARGGHLRGAGRCGGRLRWSEEHRGRRVRGQRSQVENLRR